MMKSGVINIYLLFYVGILTRLSPFIDKFARAERILDNSGAIYDDLQIVDGTSEALLGIRRKLHDAEEFIRTLQIFQRNQFKHINDLIQNTKNTLALLEVELVEKDLRMAQLRYSIDDMNRNHPYFEKFETILSRNWRAIDFTDDDSLWMYDTSTRNRKDFSICQKGNLNLPHYPSTILLLKSRSYGSGFVSSKILLEKGVKNAAGIVFLYFNPYNFWRVELERNLQGTISLVLVSDGISRSMTQKNVNLEQDNFYKVACQFDSKYISVFFEGNQILQLDLSNDPTIPLGMTGVYTRLGKAKFRNYFVGPGIPDELIFEDPEFRRQVRRNDHSSMNNNRSIQFREVEGYDDQAVKSIPEIPLIDYQNPDLPFDFVIDQFHVHVPDQNQTLEYDLYRSENKTETNPNTNENIELCSYYNMSGFNLSEWISLSNERWIAIEDMNLQRLSSFKAYENDGDPAILILKDRLCSGVIVSFKIRLEENSEGGIAFRIVDKSNFYLAAYSTKNNTISLMHKFNGRMTLLKKLDFPLGPQVRFKITVQDYAAQNGGLINILLNDVPVISHSDGIFDGRGHDGPALLAGHGVFDSLELYPIQ